MRATTATLRAKWVDHIVDIDTGGSKLRGRVLNVLVGPDRYKQFRCRDGAQLVVILASGMTASFPSSWCVGRGGDE